MGVAARYCLLRDLVGRPGNPRCYTATPYIFILFLICIFHRTYVSHSAAFVSYQRPWLLFNNMHQQFNYLPGTQQSTATGSDTFCTLWLLLCTAFRPPCPLVGRYSRIGARWRCSKAFFITPPLRYGTPCYLLTRGMFIYLPKS